MPDNSRGSIIFSFVRSYTAFMGKAIAQAKPCLSKEYIKVMLIG
ncbi:MAG TPA: hypothetical protein V6D30_18050 [Leptolyngbyaceae cyanobacterium]